MFSFIRSKLYFTIHVRLRQVRIRMPTLALKPRDDVTRSLKQGYQWPHKKDLCPPKIKKETNLTIRCFPVAVHVSFRLSV